MGGGMHDCAVTAWGMKGWYDYLRPISAIRAMAELGQSSDPLLPNYDAGGLLLIPGYIELIEAGDALEGDAGENINEIKVLAWRGHSVINNVDLDEAGVDWILASEWVPYQRPSFVSPPFSGYMSGHSTFSRAAAEIMEAITGDEFFPGGMGVFDATQDQYLVFEDGPSQTIQLQWATYRDAADESGLSRIWGGIHPPVDDIPGRIIGEQIGWDVFAKANGTYFNPPSCPCTACIGCTDTAACNYDSTAVIDDGSCQYLDACGNCGGTSTAGCIDTTACNYDSTASCDDGTCDFGVCTGCTDSAACNYNPAATSDD